MFRPAFGVMERILLRRFSQTVAAGSQSKLAGARLQRQHFRSNVGAAGRNFGFLRRNQKSQAMAIAALSTTVGIGLGYMSKNLLPSQVESVESCVGSTNLLPSEIESVEACVISKNLLPSEIDSVEDGEKVHPSEIDSVEPVEKLHPSKIDSVETGEKLHASEIESVEAGEKLLPSEIGSVEAGKNLHLSEIGSVEAGENLHVRNQQL